MTRRQLLIATLLGSVSVPVPAWAERPPQTVRLQPLGGEIPKADVKLVSEALSCFYDVKLDVAEPLALPKEAFYAPRRRYRAEKLLDFLAAAAEEGTFRMLGLTSVDVSTTKGNTLTGECSGWQLWMDVRVCFPHSVAGAASRTPCMRASVLAKSRRTS